MSTMSQGLVLITTGVLVVLSILIILALSVEIIVLYDNFRRKQTRKKAALEKQPDPDKVPAEVVAAIGLGLHEYFAQESQTSQELIVDRRRSSTWSASGRLDIMSSRQRITAREK